ncbi:hypothetical protein [Longimicrobium sp.]|uniref:hypothetical protein n=1 Tax=Longimicrobium sp. TaxID=2029185 RepID=UPI002EDAFE76
MPGATALLICEPGEAEHVEVAIYDGLLQPLPLAYNLGRVEVQVVPGAYKVEFRTGAQTRSRIAVVAEGEVREVFLDERLPVASAAPMDGSSTSHEYQMGPAARESREPPLPPPPQQVGGSHLFLFVRDHEEESWSGENPAAGLSLHRLDGRLLYDLGRAGARDDSHGRYDAQGHWTSLHADLDPGVYLLRLETATKGVVQQVVHLCRGWQTQVFLLARSYGRGHERRRQADLARGSVFMAPAGVGFRPAERQLYLTEVALRALADGRAVPGAERTQMMGAKFENPMLGLYGAFLHLRRPRIDPDLMRTVFHNLFWMLGWHPDVLALGWALVARWAIEGHSEKALGDIRWVVENAGAMRVPPMLRTACDAVTAASFTNPGLVAPDSLAERVTSRMLLSGPWLLWTATADELRETPLPPAAAPSVTDILENLRPQMTTRRRRDKGRATVNSIRFGEAIQEWEAVRGPDDPFSSVGIGITDRGPGTVLARLQRSLDEVSHRLQVQPHIAKRLVDDPSLTPLERRVVLAAFPEADPLFGAMLRRGSPGMTALLQSTRPTAADLAASLGAPAGTLSRAVLAITDRVYRLM